MSILIKTVYELFLLLGCIFQNIYRHRSLSIPKSKMSSKDILNNQRIFILGNGPSLNEDIKNYQLSKNNSYLVALNKFAISQEFNLLRPKLYVLPDRRFWDPEYSEKDRKIQNQILEAFKNANWHIQILIPKEAFSYFQNKLKRNKFLVLIPYNERALPITNIKLSAWALSMRICTPIPINSLVMAAWFSLQKNITTITILGSDFDFFKGLNTDQIDNSVSFSVAHFYGNDNNLQKPEITKDKNKPFHIRLLQVSQAFQQLHVLDRYAKLSGRRILNGSSFSLIDAFDRERPDR